MADALTAGEIAAFHERATEPANGDAQCWSNWVIAELCDAARESLRLRGLIDAHNAGMAARCARSCDDPAEHERAVKAGNRGRCVACPRRDMIDADAAPAEVAR